MTSVMARDVFGSSFLNELQSKVKIDKVNGVEIKKPEIVVSGLDTKTGESVDKPQLNGNHYAPILAEPPIFRKEIGVSMSEETVERFVKIPRELLEDPNWRGMRIKYQRLFLIILEEVSFTSRTFKHNGNSITVLPGQLCVTFRRLAELYNRELRFKEDQITPSLVQRAVSVYFQFGFAIHESIHGIMRLTITQRELCDHFKRQADTASDTKPIQNRYTNEERKEGEELKETIDGAIALDSSLLNLEKEEQKKGPSVFKPQAPTPQLSEEKQKHMQILWEFIVKNLMQEHRTPNGKPGIKEKDLSNWLAKYEGKEIMECLKMTLKAQPSRTWPGYVTKLLRDRIPKKEADSVTGKHMVEEIVKKNKMTHIDLKQDYFVDLISNDQMYYHLNPEVIKGFLKRSFDRAKEHEQEQKRQKEYEENY